MKIISVAVARPDFMKIAPFLRAIEKHNLENGDLKEHVLVHTGSITMSECPKRFSKPSESRILISILK